jgi:hypothetical protein
MVPFPKCRSSIPEVSRRLFLKCRGSVPGESMAVPKVSISASKGANDWLD